MNNRPPFEIYCHGGAINCGCFTIECPDEKELVWIIMTGYMGGEERLILGTKELKAIYDAIGKTLEYMNE